ncbi:MAG: hypothetical protein ACREA0_25870, partial [bacterium]
PRTFLLPMSPTVQTLPHCGGPLKITAAIEHPPSLRTSSPTSACPPEHRPDPRHGYSTDSE